MSTLNTASLSDIDCEACCTDAPPLTDAQITTFLIEVPQWKVERDGGVAKLKRSYKFSNFAKALAFTNQVGELAETANHHPVLVTEWGSVTVIWWTHKVEGLHKNDFIMAAKTDKLSLSVAES